MKIALLGYGKMGKAIEREALAKGHEIGLIVHSENAAAFGVEQLRGIDVAIDFSRPESAYKNIQTSIDAGVPVVSGTTGWLDKMDEIKMHCVAKNGAFLYASNFSVGVNLFFRLNKILSKIMNLHPEYEPVLEEIHHTQKLDAPSGTGISLANDLIAELARKEAWVKGDGRRPGELSVISKRVDDVPGTHLIEWVSEIDTIEIKHTAHSRRGFVLGAILAAEWIQNKQGVFGMEDVL